MLHSPRGKRYGRRSQQHTATRRTSSSPQKQHHSRYISAAVDTTSVVEVPQSTRQFSDFALTPELQEAIASRGYTKPTPIQDQVIPALLEGRDVVGIANTGTGKTAAFLVPFLNKVVLDRNQGVLIIAPTRELAVQIADELRLLTKKSMISMSLCIGGTSLSRQIDELKRNPHFVIGTPGRLKDVIVRKALKTEAFTTIVLDEVDRMLDIGFRKDIIFLIDQLPQDRQTAFFSATLDQDTKQIMHKLLRNPVTISVKKEETSRQVHQDIIPVPAGADKINLLCDVLRKEECKKVIVFGRTKRGVNKLEKKLLSKGFKVAAIHGNKSQNARQRSLEAFKRGGVLALLATDIAARGIDVTGVTHVINFDEPATYQDYVHRIGRTGRAGAVGKALTFVAAA